MALVSEDGVEDDDEPAHAGHEGLLAGFAGGPELGVVSGDDRIGAAGDQSPHVGRRAHGGVAAGDSAAAAQRAAVAIDRRDPDQGGDLAAVEMAEFGQLGDQGNAHHEDRIGARNSCGTFVEEDKEWGHRD